MSLSSMFNLFFCRSYTLPLSIKKIIRYDRGVMICKSVNNISKYCSLHFDTIILFFQYKATKCKEEKEKKRIWKQENVVSFSNRVLFEYLSILDVFFLHIYVKNTFGYGIYRGKWIEFKMCLRSEYTFSILDW